MVYKAYVDKLGCSPKIASLLTKLTTYHRRIPQGAPTSPAVANLVLLDLHSKVSEIVGKAGLKVTFYIDDIIISGSLVEPTVEPVIKEIQKAGYAVSNKKKKLMPANMQQKVTGLIVNRKVNIPEKFVENLRSDILKALKEDCVGENIISTLRGKIAHIRQVNSFLADKIDAWLDGLEISVCGKEKNDKNEYRECRCAKRHRHRYMPLSIGG